MSDNQSIASLGEPVGFVTQLEGTVRAVSLDGQERSLKIGDPVFQGETVVAVADGSATINFVDGTEIYVADASAVEINSEVYGLAQTPQENEFVEDFLADGGTDIAALQQAILEGQDPTQVQEAPAAGEAPADDTPGGGNR